MDHPTVKKTTMAFVAVLAFLALPVALAVVGGWDMWKERRARREQETEFNEALRRSLERAADVVLPSPTLGADALEVQVPPDRLDAEVRRVIRLAEGVGGSASSWNDGRSTRVVANVPGRAEALFRESVTRGVYDLASAGDSGPMTVVEVLVEPAGGASGPVAP